jgi:glycerol-3-phosphate dehydrogenase
MSIYAGLRPLVKHAGTKNTAALSRDHTIVVSESGLITITGGKWTTYRRMGQDVVDRAQEVAGLKETECGTESLRLHGAGEASILEPEPEAVDEHWRVYGTDLAEIQEVVKKDAELAERIHPRLEYTKAEVVWQARMEMAQTVEDVLARRTRALLLDARAAMEAAPVVAGLLARELEKDERWALESAEAFRRVAAGYVFD